MTVRIATVEDLDLVVSMSMKFATASAYKEYISEDKIRSLAEGFLKASKEQVIVLISEEDGMLIGIASPFLYGDVMSATEVVWWISPDNRGKKAGTELLEAFEFWAKKIGCKLMTVCCLDDRVGKYYETKGFSLYERAYLKEI
jgi:GNAT superfamily N-acetyltransferase